MSTTALDPELVEFVLAFADDEHLIGARHTSWIGLGPFLEEDLAFCSIAQDELGHALALYQLITEDIDHFALLRAPGAYRSCWLAEWPCDQWQDALVRQWLYDRAELLRWQALERSTFGPLAAIAAGAEREESFHRAHAELFLTRITSPRTSDGTARERVLDAVERLLPVALGLWDAVEGESAALAEGLTAASSDELRSQWSSDVQADLARWALAVDWPTSGPDQRARTVRSPGFGPFQQSLQEVIAADPAALW